MTDLVGCKQAGPPATTKKISRFLLFAPEKAVAMQTSQGGDRRDELAKGITIRPEIT